MTNPPDWARGPNASVHSPPPAAFQPTLPGGDVLAAMRDQLIEMILQEVTLALQGFITAGTSAFIQLSAWATAVLLDGISSLAEALGVPAGDVALVRQWFTDLRALLGGINILGLGSGGPFVLPNIADFPLLRPFFQGPGTGFPKSFPTDFATALDDLESLVPLAQFQQLVDGLANNGMQNNPVHAAISGVRQLGNTVHSEVSQAIQDGIAGIEGAGAAITQSLQSFPNRNVQGISLGQTIGDDLQAVVDGGMNALDATEGLVGHAVSDFEAGLSMFLTQQFNNWTGNNKARAGAADLSAAALSAAEQSASLSHQTAAIAAQLPQFYGGSGVAGIGVEIPFKDGLPVGDGATFAAISSTQYQYSGSGGYDGTPAAQSDSETVSGIWSTIIPANTWRGIYLRANTTGTTRVWARWRVVGNPAAGTWGPYYLPSDTSAAFEVQIGCDVAGVAHTLHTFGPWPLWSYAGNVVVTGYSIHWVGPWYFSIPEYLPDYGPGYSAGPGYGMYLNSGNNAISLEATANTFVLNYPGAGQISTDDTGPTISLSGSAYRNGGFTDDAGAPGTQASWAFWDSGPTSGPQTAPIATLESTSSTGWVDLTTIGPEVTVNVGNSGLALVIISAGAFSDATNHSAEMGFAAFGTNTIAAGVNQNLLTALSLVTRASAMTLVTGLDPGPTTFVAKYRVDPGGTAYFLDRDIIAIPL